MMLPKTPIRDIDLDELERQLRECEPLYPKNSTLGASEYPQSENARTICRKNPKNTKSGRENPRDRPAPASSVHPRQKSMRGSATKANVDDIERQLREVASSALRKSPPPRSKGNLLVARNKQPGGTVGQRFNADLKAAAAGATSDIRLMQAGWRPVILQTHSERSVVARCARALALPLLLLSLGAGTLVVLSPEGALTNIDHSLEVARAKQAGRDDQKPSQGAVVIAGSFDQPSQSKALAEQPAHAMASSVSSPGGEAGPTQAPALVSSSSSGAASPGETSSVRAHDAAEMVPDRVAEDDQRPSPSALDSTRSSFSPTKQLLDGGGAAAPSAQAEIVDATRSPNAVIALRSGALPGEVGSEVSPPGMAGLATPQASISLPTVTPSPTPDAAASSSFAIESNGSNPGSLGDAVSEVPASVLAALATSEVPKPLPTVTPSPAPDEAASPSLAAKPIESKSGSNSEAVSEAPALVMADLATPQASISLPQLRPRQHRMRLHHPRLPLNPTVRIRAHLVMLFPKCLHQFWPPWRCRRCSNPCRQSRPRQRRMTRHPLRPRLLRATNRPIQDHAQVARLYSTRRHLWRRKKRQHRCLQLPRRLRTPLRK
jgi:hypothetical protein